MVRARPGFTLIELLVVIAIIGILVGLLLPAVQKVREAASNTQCNNNLKQIALGMILYHDNGGTNRFPQGGGDPGSQNPAIRAFYFGWTFQIYPFIEQQSLYNLVPNPTDPFYDISTDANGSTILNTLDTTPVKIFYCPARRIPKLYHGDAITDYAGNSGTTGTDGVIVLNNSPNFSGVRMGHVVDGKSNTMLVGERRINIASMNSTSDCYDNEPAVRAANDCDVLRRAQVVGTSWLTPAQDLNDPTNTNYFCGSTLCQFGSSHPRGMYVALCDGSVRRVGYGVDPTTFMSLCAREDRKVVDFSLLD